MAMKRSAPNKLTLKGYPQMTIELKMPELKKYAITKDSVSYLLVKRYSTLESYLHVFADKGFAYATDMHSMIKASTNLPNGTYKPNGEKTSDTCYPEIIRRMDDMVKKPVKYQDLRLTHTMVCSLLAEIESVVKSFDPDKLVPEMSAPEKFTGKPKLKKQAAYINFKGKYPTARFEYKTWYNVGKIDVTSVDSSYQDEILVDRMISEVFDGFILDLDYLVKVLKTLKKTKADIIVRRRKLNDFLQFTTEGSEIFTQILLMPIKQ